MSIKTLLGSFSTPIRVLPAEVVELPTLALMREAVTSLALLGTQSVTSVRTAFVSGIAPLQVAGPGSVSSYVTSFSKDLGIASRITKSTAQFGLKTSTAGSSVPPPKPELDSADVIEGPGGVLDQFSVRLTISLRVDQLSRVKSIKVMRAKLGTVKAVRPAISALSYAPVTNGKNIDRVAASAFRSDEIGVGNKLASFVLDDPTALRRAVTSPDSQNLRPPVAPQNTNRGEVEGLLQLQGADRSVIENVSFYINRRTQNAIPKPEFGDLNAGNSIGVNVLRGSSVSAASSGMVQSPNSLNFSEIARIDMGSSNVRTIGDILEATLVDKAVVYGTGFVYCVSCIGLDDNEGPRSKLVNVSVVRSVPPQSPTVIYSVVGGIPRFTIHCKPGVDHVEIFRSGRAVADSIRLATDQSVVVQGPATKIGHFWHLTDVGIATDGSTTFVDAGAVPGDKLGYRIYAVDPYGLKSQTPFSCSLKLPDHGLRVPIPVPSITVEQSPGQPSISIKMQVDDPRVAGFTVQRRDVTIFEKSVHQANQPEFVDIGVSTPKRAGSRRGPTLLDADWPAYIPASAGSASYIDTSVKLDRKYQYAIGAVDIRGNKTLLVGSAPVGVYAKTVIDPPLAFSANVAVESYLPIGVLLKWDGGTNDFSPNTLLGDQDVLSATSVRSVFQVERRHVGAPFWDALPVTSESYFFDKVSTDEAPAFRPAYVTTGERYEYRVLAMQSGGFISPRSDIISISVEPPAQTPAIVWVRSTPTSVNPMSIVVSWAMPSNFVDRWEVERAVTNKFYGEQITSMDSKLAKGLSYVRVADITPESSRARSISYDESVENDKSVYVGNRYYVDSDVNRGNSYFYRVRTVGRLGIPSGWNYAGIVIKDQSFDRKFNSTLSDNVKITLSTSQKAVSVASITRDTQVTSKSAFLLDTRILKR